MRTLRIIAGLAIAALFAAPAAASAQSATPAATPAAPGEVVASGLTNPRGFSWGADGAMYVALAGNDGLTAAVVKIVGGKATPVASGLPSHKDKQGSVRGVADVAQLNGDWYALIEGGGVAEGHADTPAGVYKLGADGKATLVADLNKWVVANPVAQPPDHEPNGNPFSMIAGKDALMVVIANPDEVVKVAVDGTVTRIADLTTQGHNVLTGIAAGPDGSAYVGVLTAFPYTDGTTKVVKIAADGAVSDAWTGLTAVTGVAVGKDGTLYAIELSTGNSMKTAMTPGTGKLVKQTGPATSAEVAGGLTAPIALRVGPDGAAYVASPAVGANNGEGTIVKIALS